MKSFPGVGGSDGAGTVEELGEGVTSFQKGDRVLLQCLDYVPDRGTFQQYAIADAHRISKIPNNLSFDEAATVPLGLATAAVGLYAPKAPMGGAALTPPWVEGGKDKYKDQPALVTGGSSSVGQFAIQLLKLSGFNPIISTTSARNFDYVRAAGATHVVDYHTTPYASLRAAVEKITAAPIPVVYDAISSDDSQRASWDILAPNGAMVVTTGMRQPVVGKPGEDAEDGKHLARVYGSVDAVKDVEFGNQLYASLTELLESGALKPNQVEILPNGLAGVPDAVARFGRGAISGAKLVARVGETP
ncbi:GroES-like protein [Dentipellis sp. KUC8613]|nr:GroES-like protein [Dentipellis sp. KUC8613]